MKFLLLLSLVCVQIILASCKQRVVCYWPNYRMDASGDEKHTPENIDPTLCTHIHYSFHTLDSTNNVIMETGGPKTDVYNRLNALKQKNPDLKIIVSVGGGGQPNEPYSQLVNDPARRQAFTKNTIAYLKKYKFDGLDIDWEYPVCWSGDCSKGPKSDKPNFGKLLTELKAAFIKESPTLSLSAAIPSGYAGGPADQAYDIPAMAAALDYLAVMTYDMAGVWDKKTGHHSTYQGCISGSKYYVDKGMPKDKVLMGVPFYGHTFKLQDKNKHGMGAPIAGEGQTPHGAQGSSFYREMCDLVKNQGWAKEDPDQGHDPISYKDFTWVGYDDPYAAYDKSKWVKDNGYGGIIVWEITQDDFHPKCCSKSYPMLRAINNGLYGTGSGPDTYGCEKK